MPFLAVCFITSLVISLVVIRSSGRHGEFSADHDLSGPQKFHSRPVPRIGGVAIFAAVTVGACAAMYWADSNSTGMWFLLVASLPTFVFGLAEDLTKRVSPRRRLFFTAASAALAVWLLDAVIRRTDIPGIDHLVSYEPAAVALTIFAVTGVANAVNIIDGFNGLASMCVLMMMLAIAYVGFQVGDSFIVMAAMIGVGAVLGFFIWNFPAGLIFLGDGGAYFLGFMVAELSVLLIVRHPQVSPLFPLLACAYPIFETIFTMYRRRFIRGVATGAPDGIHLHTLIHRRLIRPQALLGTVERRQTRRNSMTSPYLWVLCLLSVIPSVLWWYSTPVLAVSLALFMGSYVFLYWRIVRFKTPRWLGLGR
jgi:UDP-N-acetylmuramyl pentapeptide phosphotransferase/UDP-N-acetylglucosamine-1-phosphate transferase